MKKMFTKISYCLTVALGITMFSSAAIAIAALENIVIPSATVKQ